MSNQQNYHVHPEPVKANASSPPPSYPNYSTQSTAPQVYPIPHPHPVQPPNPIYNQPVVYQPPPVMLPPPRPVGNCPSGGDHDFVKHYSLPGYLLAIFCFPCGVCCCLCMKEKQCKKCLGHFG